MSERSVETREWIVEGRVQGVAFRASARRQALALGLGGLAENLADGRVRVLAVGDAASLERFAEWLRDGPPAARVERLTSVEPASGERHDVVGEGFVTR